MNLMLAQAGGDIAHYAVLIVVIAVIVALVALALRSLNIAIPAWAVQAFWIVLLGLGIIFAIHLFMRFV